MRLSPKEAAEARQRRLEYEHSMAIEGIVLTPEEKLVLDDLDEQLVGYDERIQFGLEWCRKDGLIPDARPLRARHLVDG